MSLSNQVLLLPYLALNLTEPQLSLLSSGHKLTSLALSWGLNEEMFRK